MPVPIKSESKSVTIKEIERFKSTDEILSLREFTLADDEIVVNGHQIVKLIEGNNIAVDSAKNVLRIVYTKTYKEISETEIEVTIDAHDEAICFFEQQDEINIRIAELQSAKQYLDSLKK